MRWRREIAWQRLGYAPSCEQRAFHDGRSRLRLVAGGERGGKSYSTAMDYFAQGPRPGGLGWIVAATYELARPELLYILDGLTRLNAVAGKPSVPASGPCLVRTIWHETIVTRSSDDVLKIAAKAPDWIIMAEAAQQTYEAYLRLSARLTERRGRMVMSGTFEGAGDWYHDMYNAGQAVNDLDLRSFSIPTWSNRAVFPGGRDDPEIRRMEAAMPPDRFMERFGAIPCPAHNLVFREFSHATHVKECPYDARLPVEVWVDPGWAHAYAVLAVQYHGDEVWVIDEVYERGLSSQQIILAMRTRLWGAGVRSGVIDVAGNQHANTDGKSAQEVWLANGIALRSQPVGVRDGIDRTKTFLCDPLTKRPRILFDPRCKGTIREFAQYKYPLNTAGDARSDVPIDMYNDGLKALAYGLVDKYGVCGKAPLPKPATQPGAAWLMR